MTTTDIAEAPTSYLDMRDLPDAIRMRVVSTIVEQVARTERRRGDALLFLDLCSLTGDRAALDSALAAPDDPSYVAAIATLATPSAS